MKRLSLLPSDAISAARSRMTAVHIAPFSTTPISYKGPPKGGQTKAPKTSTKSFVAKKGKRQETGRRPAPGERKAARKRIVLSNTNALEVPGLQDLKTESLKNAASMHGEMRALPDSVVDSLRAVEAFKPTQGWHLFRKPATLMRKESVQLANMIESVAASESKQETVRVVINGERLAGKSTLLLQALAMGFLKEWVVINIPDAQELANGSTEYTPIRGSEPLQYLQRRYVQKLLGQIVKANADLLAAIPVTQSHTLPIKLKPGITLDKLCAIGIETHEFSWPIYQALWTELSAPGRPPIMFAVDNLSHIMRPTEYLTPELTKIHAHDLAFVSHFTSLLSGATRLPNGGLVLGVTSASNSPANPSLEHAIAVNAARGSAHAVPDWNPYHRIDKRVLGALRGVAVVDVRGLSKEEARAVMEYYAASGMLRAKVTEPLVSEKWTLAGNGNIGELERSSVKYSRI